MRALRRRAWFLSALSLFALSAIVATTFVPFAHAQGIEWTRAAVGDDVRDQQAGSLQESSSTGGPGEDGSPATGSGNGSGGGANAPGGGTPGGSGGPSGGPSGPSGATGQVISLPGAEGSIEGMGESFAPILSSGTATFEVPVAVVPGRAGVEPALSIRYASTSGDGPLGVGWSIGVPFIARQTDRGLPAYVDRESWHAEEDRFVYNGGQELVPVDNALAGTVDTGSSDTAVPAEVLGWQQYRARVEGGFMRFFRSPDSRRWIVQAKDGTRYDFGSLPVDEGPLDFDSGPALETESGVGAGPAFQWHLTRQSDAHGSTIYYQYFVDAGRRYLEDVYYTSPASCAAPGDPDSQRSCSAPLRDYGARIAFQYEARPDATSSYVRGWRVENRLRLSRVTVSAADQSVGTRYFVRRYRLEYDPWSHHSLLVSLQLEGRPSSFDPATGARVFSLVEEGTIGPTVQGDTLPPMEFGYSAQPTESLQVPGFGGVSMTVQAVGNSPERSFDSGQAELFDVNSDGLPDFIVTDPARYRSRDGEPAVGVFFNGFIGEAASPAGATAVFSDAVPVPPGDGLSDIFLLNNRNLVRMDVNGDGRGDFLHLIRRGSYGWFTPVRDDPGEGTPVSPAEQGWRFDYNGVELPPSDNDPRVDLLVDPTHYRAFDVNNDHLIDIVQTTGTVMRTWLNLGWVPGGEGRFGQAQWDESQWTLSTEPIESCLLHDGQPLDFGDPEVRLADMNGDGLQDIVRIKHNAIVYWPGRGVGVWGDGPAACERGEGAGREIRMGTLPTELDFNLAGVSLSDVNADGASDIVQVRFGEADVWFNQSGIGFSERAITSVPESASFDDDVRFADIDGSATLDLVVARAGGWQYLDFMGGTRPRLLNTVSNGLGALTTLTYGSSGQDYVTDLSNAEDCDSSSDCESFTWSHVGEACDPLVEEFYGGVCNLRPGGSPVISTVVRASETTDQFDQLARERNTLRTEYAYHNGYYEGIEQEFRGFGAADAREVGDSDAPSEWTRTWFHQGRRPNAIANDRLADNLLEAIKGRAWRTDRFDERGRYLSTEHTTWALRDLMTGLDGRRVAFAYESQTDTLLYDVGDFKPAAESIILPKLWHQTVDPSNGNVSGELPLFLATELRSAQYAHVRSEVASQNSMDNVGNVVLWDFEGRLREQDGNVPASEMIRVGPRPILLNDDGQWIWRNESSYVGGNLHLTFHEYNAVGDRIGTRVTATTTLDYEYLGDGSGALEVQAWAYEASLETETMHDAFGNPTSICRSNGLLDFLGVCERFVDVEYDAAYGQLPALEGVAVENSSRPYCTMKNGYCRLETVAAWDRGLGKVTAMTDPNGQTADVGYDGLGRPTFLRPPVTARCSAKAGEPTRRLEYDVAPGGLPVSIVTITEDDGRAGCDQSFLLETRSYVDGLGRARATLTRSEQSNQWEQSGASVFSPRGNATRLFNNRFVSGADPEPNEALAISSSVPHVHTRTDAFGRPVLIRERDGSQTRVVHHALSTDTWDSLDSDPSSIFSDTYATIRVDGHGRVIDQVQRQRKPDGGAIEFYRLITDYRADNRITSLTRAQTTSAARWEDATVVDGRQRTRVFTYDRVGRLRGTTDPDTNAPGGDPGSSTWRYLYNAVDDLVGVRDPRGCGLNLYHDLAGRLVGEDYVECVEAMNPGPFTDVFVTGSAISDGGPISGTQSVDVRYYYDEDPPWSGSLTAATSPPANRHLAGRLTAVSSRGERSLIGYDARGEQIWSARQMALLPDPPGGVPTELTDPVQLFESETVASGIRAYDEAHTYETHVDRDFLDRQVGLRFPADPDWIAMGGSGPAPVVSGQLEFNRRGLPNASTVSVDGSATAVARAITYDEHQLPKDILIGPSATPGNPTHSMTYDARLRPRRSLVTRVPSASDPARPLSAVSTVCDDHLIWDSVSNLVQTIDGRDPTEWPDGHRPVRRVVSHDALYRVVNVAHYYRTDSRTWGVDDLATDWRDERTRPNGDGVDHETADPMRGRPAPRVAPAPSNRVVDLTYDYDWLANMVEWSDDAGVFYERSIGLIRNGVEESALRPSALYFASDIRESPANYEPGVNHGGYVSVDYGDGGNVETFTVRAICFDRGVSELCVDTGGTPAERASNLDANCNCQRSQHYQYRYDELNRLVEARRYDRAGGAGVWLLQVRQRYQYDGANVRTHKSTFADPAPLPMEPAERTTLYVYPGDYERRGLVPNQINLTYDANADLGTETQYLVSGARLVWKSDADHLGLLTREQRLTYALSDVIESTSAVVDLLSGDLIEHTTFYPNGARETHRTTDTISLPLEPVGFTGKEADEEVGLVYFGERYLIPRLGRWSTPDPLQIHAAGGGESLNSYHYISGNLLQGRDPLGLQCGKDQSCATNTNLDANVAGVSSVDNSQITFSHSTSSSSSGGQTTIGRSDFVDETSDPRQIVEILGVHATRAEADATVAAWVAADAAAGGGKLFVAHYRDGDFVRPTTITQTTAPNLFRAGKEHFAATDQWVRMGNDAERAFRAIEKGIGSGVGARGVQAGVRYGAKRASGTALSVVRENYLSTVDEVAALARRLHARGMSAEDVVRQVAPIRNEVKLNARASGPWIAARAADVRNLLKYGNRAGPSADDLYKKYGTWEGALEAIGRTSPKYDKLAR